MPRDDKKIRARVEELRRDHGLLVAKGMAQQEDKIERLTKLRVSANMTHQHELIELIDIVREVIDGR